MSQFSQSSILYTDKLQGLNFLHSVHCPCHGYPSHSYCYCFHPLLSLPKPLFLFLPLIFLLLWDAYCLSYFSPAVLNWPLRKAMPSIITYHCWFSLAERNDCCRGYPGPDDRWLDVCYGCSPQIHEQQKFPSLMAFSFFLECAPRIRNLKWAGSGWIAAQWNTLLSGAEEAECCCSWDEMPSCLPCAPTQTFSTCLILVVVKKWGSISLINYLLDIVNEAI